MTHLDHSATDDALPCYSSPSEADRILSLMTRALEIQSSISNAQHGVALVDSTLGTQFTSRLQKIDEVNSKMLDKMPPASKSSSKEYQRVLNASRNSANKLYIEIRSMSHLSDTQFHTHKVQISLMSLFQSRRLPHILWKNESKMFKKPQMQQVLIKFYLFFCF